MLEFRQVSYSYAGSQTPAISNLNLTIPAGKRCAVIGQNGCGKTTLFLLANGLYKPQSGGIYWQGQALRYDRASLTRLRQQIGLVFQDPEQQLVASTVEEDLSYGLCNQGLAPPVVRERVQQAIVDFNLTDLTETPVHNLSLGQKKRVSIADVMVLRPGLLLLDEPTAYLDPLHTRNLMATLKLIEGAGTTVLMATHDLDLVYRWADWVFVVDRGGLVLEGSPQMVFSHRKLLEDLELGAPLMSQLMDEVVRSLGSSDGNFWASEQAALFKEQMFQRFRFP
jgi:cobalt/nickel transport system ATP-binding protein